MFHQLRLGVRIATIRPGRVCHYCRVELLAEFTTQFRDPPLGIFGKLLRCCPFLNRIHRLAGMIFEIAQHAFQLLFHFADLRQLFLLAFHSQMRLLPLQFLFALVQK